jgi:ABC-type sugar transport system permease subunit
MKTLLQIYNIIYLLFRYLVPVAVFALAFRMVFHPSYTTINSIGILLGLVAMEVIFHTFELKAIASFEIIKKEMRIPEVQEIILKEMQIQNDRIFNLHTANANALSKMTTLAAKNGNAS